MLDENKYISLDLLNNTLDLSNNNLDLSNNTLDLSDNTLDLSNNTLPDNTLQDNTLLDNTLPDNTLPENILDLPDNDITCLCFGAGGVKGIAFIGALEKLIEYKKIELNKIKMYVGTSAGGIVSFLLNLDFTIEEIKEFIITFNFSKLNEEVDCVNLLEKFGINNGDRIKLLFIKFLELKFNVKDITFKELFNKTQKKLLIIATNLTKSQEELFSVDTTPDMSVIIAIRISVSIPIIFTPVIYNDSVYVDGALYNIFPINYCPIDKTFGIYIKNCNNNLEINSIQSFILTCLNITADTITEKYLNSGYKNVIKIINPKPELQQFELTLEYKKSLIELGYTSVNNYFELF
jgi:predicted acylesterase/phospholipase RssA